MTSGALPEIDKLDYFQLFNLDRDAGADDVRAAFHDFARRYHPDLYVQGPAKKRLAAARVYRRATEAYRVLLDSQKRAAYLKQLEQGRLRLAPGTSIPPRAMDTGGSSNPLAAKHMNEARLAMQRGDYVAAHRQLKSAKVFDPKNEQLGSMLEAVQEKL